MIVIPFQRVSSSPILPVRQDDVDARAPLIERTTTAIFPPEGETSNVEQETRPKPFDPIKPRYTAEEMRIKYKNDFSKHTRGQIAKDALWTIGSQIASLTKGVGTAALTAVTVPWVLEKFLPKDSEAYLYSRLVLTHYLMNGAIAGINEGGRQLLKATTGVLTQKTVTKQYVKRLFKENDKMIQNFLDYLSGNWRPTLPERAAMMAQAMRGRSNDAKFEYHESQASLAIVDKAIDKYLENGKPGDVDAFDNFYQHLRAWELMARAPLPHEFTNLFHLGKNGDPAKQAELDAAQAELDAAQAEVEAMAPATIRNQLSSFMTVWRLSTLPGTPPSKDLIALVGNTKLPDGTDLAEEMCKKLTKKDPVIVTADNLNEFIDVVLPKEAVPRVKQKTADPEEAIGKSSFLKWIESGNSACPIVITKVDFKNSKHVRLIENLRESTEIDIYYDEIKGAKFTVNTQRTRFILCASEPDHRPKMPHLVAHAVIGSPSEEDRHKVLDLTLKKQRKGILDGFSFTEGQKDDIERLIRQDKHANLIIEKSMKHNLSYDLMRGTINEILAGISLGYNGIGALKGLVGIQQDTQQEQPASAEGEAGPSVSNTEKETIDNDLEKFIKDRFKAFPKQTEGKDKKDAKGKSVAEPPQKKYGQAPTNGLNSASLAREYAILCAKSYD